MNRRQFLKNSLFLFTITGFPNFTFAIGKPNSDLLTKNKIKNDTPPWFLENRIQAHTRLDLSFLKKNSHLFWNGNKIIKNFGAQVVTRHFKSGGEGAWWFSKYGEISPIVKKLKINIAKKIIDDAHKIGLHIVAYYRHMEDNYIVKAHSDWLCRDWNGKPIETLTKRGYYTCFNSPYKEFVKNRLIELTKLGIDGFFFDEDHMPRNGCWCNYCQKKFKRIYKLNPPLKKDPSDKIWAKNYVEFNNKTVEQTFLYWKKEIKKINKNCVFIISLNFYPTLFYHHLSTKLMKISDSVKSEINFPIRKYVIDHEKFLFEPKENVKFRENVKLALGYTLVRDGANKHPAHIWIPQVFDDTIAKSAVAGVLTYGNIANVDIWEKYLQENKKEIFSDIFEWNPKLKQIFQEMIPFTHIGIYYSEKSRNYFVPNYEMAFRKVIYKVYKSFEACFDKKIPVTIYTDETLKNINEDMPKLLFVPTYMGLSKLQSLELKNYIKKGGIITTNIERLKYLLSKKIKFPIEINSTQSFHVGYFTNKDFSKMYIFLSNEFAWVTKIRWLAIRKNKLKIKRHLPSPFSVKISINSNFMQSVESIKTIFSNEKLSETSFELKNIEYFEIIEIKLKNGVL